MSDDDKHTLLMTYLGRRLTAKDTLAYAWQVDGEDDDRWYTKQLVSYAGVGTRWAFVPGAKDGQVLLNPRPQSRGKIDDDSKRMAWEAIDSADAYQYEEIRQAKREKDKSLIAEALLPLRIAMHRHTKHRRYAFNTAVMSELMRPLTKAEKDEAGL